MNEIGGLNKQEWNNWANRNKFKCSLIKIFLDLSRLWPWLLVFCWTEIFSPLPYVTSAAANKKARTSKNKEEKPNEFKKKYGQTLG